MTRALRKVSRRATICTYRTFTWGFIDSIMKGPFQNPVNSGRYCAMGPWLRSSVLVSVRISRVSRYLKIRGNRDRRGISREITPLSIFGQKTCEMLISPLALSPRAITYLNQTPLRLSFRVGNCILIRSSVFRGPVSRRARFYISHCARRALHILQFPHS